MKQVSSSTVTHEKIINLLKENGHSDFHGGIQLFANQYDKEYGISINFNGTGLHISKSEVDEMELIDDELIRVCKSWLYKDK